MMFIREKITEALACNSQVCRTQYERSFLLIGALGLIIYSLVDHNFKMSGVFASVELWFGAIFLIIFVASYFVDDIKLKLPFFLSKLPFIVAPSAFLTLYFRELEVYYTLFFLIMFSLMAFLFQTKKEFWLYLIVYSLGMMLVIIFTNTSLENRLLTIYFYGGMATIIAVVGSSFIWSQERLAAELYRITNLSNYSSKKLTEHVARIVELNSQLTDSEEKIEDELEAEIRIVESEIKNIQDILDNPYNPALISNKPHLVSEDIKKARVKLCHLTMGMITLELIILINMGISF